MFRLYRYQLYFLIYYMTIIESVEAMTGVSQSYWIVSDRGWEFAPSDANTLLLYETTASSIISCSLKCHMSTNCRVFNFNIQTEYCRLYEGDADTTGQIVASVSPQSTYGFIQLMSQDFASYGHSCSSCEDNRLLRCMDSICQCQAHTYFDGSICRSQKLNGSACTNYIQCRNDLNLTCQSNMQCSCEYHLSMILLSDQ